MTRFCPNHAQLIPVEPGSRICRACRRERGIAFLLRRIVNAKGEETLTIPREFGARPLEVRP